MDQADRGQLAGELSIATLVVGQLLCAICSWHRGPFSLSRVSTTRLVAKLADGVITTPRSDADIVLTERGVADLRGLPLRRRTGALVEVADPAFRAELRSALRGRVLI
ncbi:MAG: acetyl-CoA hydrolase/transferase C-terminal domain-containing protein [Trebonia sp.]